jgi:hypothetical protein
MVITPPPELVEALTKAAEEQGVTPEALAIDTLRSTFTRFMPSSTAPLSHEEWHANLRKAATHCGVSLSNSALSREEIYD